MLDTMFIENGNYPVVIDEYDKVQVKAAQIAEACRCALNSSPDTSSYEWDLWERLVDQMSLAGDCDELNRVLMKHPFPEINPLREPFIKSDTEYAGNLYA